jgi:hypothetical protein
VIQRLGRFPDRKSFGAQIAHDPPRYGHGAAVTFHGERHFVHARRGARHKSHHGMQGSGAGAFALQWRKHITAERAAGVKNNFIFPAWFAREQARGFRQGVIGVANPQDV